MTMSVRRALEALAISLLVAGCAGASTAGGASPAPIVSPVTSPSSLASPDPTAQPTVGAPGPTRLAQARPVLEPGAYRYDLTSPAVTLTVPGGWLMTETMSRHFGLRPAEFVEDNSVRTWYDMRVASRDPSCPEAPDPAFGHAAADLLDAFATRPGIVATTAEPIALGGLDGHWIDVRIDEAWTETCPFTNGMAATTLFTDDRVPDDPAFWGLGGYDERMRIIVLDDGAGSSVLVTIDAVDAASFDDLIARSMPVIETFEFETR